jgi:hypothetical protein
MRLALFESILYSSQERNFFDTGAERAMSAIGYVPNGAYLRSDDDKSNSEAATVVLRELEKVN